MTEPLPLSATIGILGGGQLGRMLSVAASRLGYRCHIFEPGAEPPAGHVARTVTTADYDDERALRTFGESVDVITYEFENVPTTALDLLESLAPIRPNREALSISQDRLTEKAFLESIGLTVAPHGDVSDVGEARLHLERMGTPAILKTRRLGYDGKGQVRIDSVDQAAAAVASLNGAPAILEGFVSFTSEISVIAARSLTGEVACFDPGENVHADGILRTTTVPALASDALLGSAASIATAVVDALEYVGVLGIELFVTDEGLVVNEIAPRVHNSGHWTQNGCAVDQFEQHIRAIAGWKLGDPARHSDVVMENLIGDDLLDLAALANEPRAGLHLYGKAEARSGRKMAHINRVTPRTGR